MELSRSIVKEFVNALNSNTDTKTPAYVHATVVENDDGKYVQIDGSSMLTPIAEVVDAKDGDRVYVTIENHRATIVGNYSYPPSQRDTINAQNTADDALSRVDTAYESAVAANQAAQAAKDAADDAKESAETADQMASEAVQKVAGVEQSIIDINKEMDVIDEQMDDVNAAANEAVTKATESATAAQAAKEAAESVSGLAEAAHTAAQAAQSIASEAQTQAADAMTNVNLIKDDVNKSAEEIAALAGSLDTLSNTMQTDYARKTELSETVSSLETQISQNAAQIQSTASEVRRVDETLSQTAADAKTLAEAAQVTAGEAKTQAAQAVTKAAEATAAAQTAQSEADTAKAAAQEAQNKANQAASDLAKAEENLATVTSRVDATDEEIAAARAAVEEAQEAATNAQTEANNAATAASSAQSKADEAYTNAIAAQTAAAQAATAAGEAQTIANQAVSNAQTAQTKANEAATTAANAQSVANAAQTKANEAANDLATAQQNLITLQNRADATDAEIAAAEAAVAAAQTKADQARADAEVAQSTANTARDNAAKAQTAADAAKAAADAAQAQADAAKNAADALAVRVTSAETKITQNSTAISLAATKTEVAQTLGGYYTRTETDSLIEQTSDSISLSVSKSYSKVISMGEQLVVNGTALLGDNTNFSEWEFDGSVANNSPGSFKRSVTGTVCTDEFFPIIPEQEYTLSLDIKSLNGLPRMYAFLDLYDTDMNRISERHHMYVPGTLTTLTKDIKDGDTKVYVNDLSKWGYTTNRYYIAVWNYKNKSGYAYPVETYTRTVLGLPHTSGTITSGTFDYTNNCITLSTAYSGVTIPAGTPVSQGSAGSNYKYIALSNTLIGTSWSSYQGTISGVDYSGTNILNKFPPGTAYAKVGFLWNHNGADDTIWITNVTVYNTTSVSNALKDSKTYADTQIKISSDGLTARLNTTDANVSNAAKTATNYMNFSNSGLVIGDMTASKLGRNVLINPDSVDIRNGSTVLATFGTTTRIGQTNSKYLNLDSSTGLSIYSAGTLCSRFTDNEIYLGKNSDSVKIYLGNGLGYITGNTYTWEYDDQSRTSTALTIHGSNRLDLASSDSVSIDTTGADGTVYSKLTSYVVQSTLSADNGTHAAHMKLETKWAQASADPIREAYTSVYASVSGTYIDHVVREKNPTNGATNSYGMISMTKWSIGMSTYDYINDRSTVLGIGCGASPNLHMRVEDGSTYAECYFLKTGFELGSTASIKWHSRGSIVTNPYIGYATDKSNATFVWSLEDTTAASGLAIVGHSNTNSLEWKGDPVATYKDLNHVETYYSSRPASANVAVIGSGTLLHFKATSTMTTGKPSYDGHILHFEWDNSNGYSSQLFLYNQTGLIQTRGMNKGTWSDWRTQLDSVNYSSYALPLSGGKLTGRVYLANDVHFRAYQTDGNTRIIAFMSNTDIMHYDYTGYDSGWGSTYYNGNTVYIRSKNGVYVDGNRVAGMSKKDTNYWGLLLPDGSDSGWVRTPTSGIIPHTASTASIGSSSWPFQNGYFTNLYRGGVAVATTDHTHEWTSFNISASGYCTINSQTCMYSAALNMVILRAYITIKPTADVSSGTGIDVATVPSSYRVSSIVPLSMYASSTNARRWNGYTNSSGTISIRANTALTANTEYELYIGVVYYKSF